MPVYCYTVIVVMITVLLTGDSYGSPYRTDTGRLVDVALFKTPHGLPLSPALIDILFFVLDFYYCTCTWLVYAIPARYGSLLTLRHMRICGFF